MRYGVLIGSATAVVLLVAASAVVFRGDRADRGTPPRPSERAAPQPAPAPAKPSEPDRAAQQPAPTPPSFDVVKVGPTGLAVIAGRAEPGARVIVRDGDKAIGEVTADRRGEWVLIPDQPIGAGNRLLSAEASNPGTGAIVKSEATVALSINPPPTGRAGETALAVVLPRDGGHGARVLQLPEGASPGQPNALSMDTAEYDAQGKVVLSGHAAPGATVQIYLGNEPLATVTAFDPPRVAVAKQLHAARRFKKFPTRQSDVADFPRHQKSLAQRVKRWQMKIGLGRVIADNPEVLSVSPDPVKQCNAVLG